MAQEGIGRESLKLRPCDPGICEALCCHDGISLQPGDEARIVSAVERYPRYFAHLPERYLTDREQSDGTQARRTAVRHFEYGPAIRSRGYGSTKCVFSTDDHRCALQVAAESEGLHKWHFKPFICWLFPLTLQKGETTPFAALWTHDPGRQPTLPCEVHHPDGTPWRELCREEIDYLERSREKE